MSSLYKSHSASAIHRNHLSVIVTSSVSQYSASVYPHRRSPLNELRFHPQLQNLCDSSVIFRELPKPIPSESDIPDDYITNLDSSRKQEISSNIEGITAQSQKEEPGSITTSSIVANGPEEFHQHQQITININNNKPTSAMSSRRSGHSSSSKGSSRRQHSTAQLIESLNTRRINTLTELRRIERAAAGSSPEDQLAFQGPMTSAWNAYVTSNNMLNELRGLTRNYPFSSEALDDAKWRVSNDPESNRSWNYAWLILVKLRDNQMISAYAAREAAKPEMWGGRHPDPQDADQLAACFVYEWNEALEQMLRHWETPPTTTGY